MFTGNCLCNQVRFGFEATPTDVSICHCSICQHTTGSAFGAYVKVSAADLTLTHGADHPGFVYVSLGTMTEGSDIRPTYHEFVGSKASWYDIQDSLPMFEESSDSN